LNILITAGPTREPLDPVRYLSNLSSGKMGYALAEAALELGHEATLVSGPVALAAPEKTALHRIETAQQMWETVQRLITAEPPDLVICTAAVADYRPKFPVAQKIKKDTEALTLELEKTPDILGSMRSVFGYQGLLVGFAAETQNLIQNAQSKLQRKGCDLIIANDVSRADIGFDSDNNQVTLCNASGQTEELPKLSKRELAALIIQRCLALRSCPPPQSGS
jgi:phosphopantothenoylcysteine decarboxylase/phosphopantothenate--cysteine ligase